VSRKLQNVLAIIAAGTFEKCEANIIDDFVSVEEAGVINPPWFYRTKEVFFKIWGKFRKVFETGYPENRDRSMCKVARADCDNRLVRIEKLHTTTGF
jgi:hypothetical protein